MVYKFIGLNGIAERTKSSIQTIVNGFNLDTQLEGFRTLFVNGRSIVGRDIETLKYSSRKNGGSASNRTKANAGGDNIFFSSSLQGVQIEVHYRLQAKTNEDFRQRLTKLTTILHQQQAKWEFTDEIGFHYIGTLTEMSDFDENKNTILSSFTINCVDPRKRSFTSFSKTGIGTSGTMDQTEDYLELKKIKLTLQGATNKLIIKNITQNLKIILDDHFNTGDVIELSNDGDITKNRFNIMNRLDLTSNKEEFNIQSKDAFNFSTSCKYEIEYYKRRF